MTFTHGCAGIPVITIINIIIIINNCHQMTVKTADWTAVYAGNFCGTAGGSALHVFLLHAGDWSSALSIQAVNRFLVCWLFHALICGFVAYNTHLLKCEIQEASARTLLSAHKSKSYEERELEYNEARSRIFNTESVSCRLLFTWLVCFVLILQRYCLWSYSA